MKIEQNIKGNLQIQKELKKNGRIKEIKKQKKNRKVKGIKRIER